MSNTLALMGWEIRYDPDKPYEVYMLRTVSGREVIVAANVVDGEITMTALASRGAISSDKIRALPRHPQWPIAPVLRDMYTHREFEGLGYSLTTLVFACYGDKIEFEP